MSIYKPFVCHCCKTIFLYGYGSIPIDTFLVDLELDFHGKIWENMGKSGKIWENTGKSPFLIGKPSISMGNFPWLCEITRW